MTALDPPRPGFRINGWHVLAMVTAFFAIVIAVDVAFVVIAVKTFPGEVSATPYEDGLAFNRASQQQRAQARLGWRATAAAEPGAVAIEMLGPTGLPLAGLTLTGDLQRPATEAGRLKLTFHETRAGRYVAHPGEIHGAWDLMADAVGPSGAHFKAERRLAWP